MSRNENPPITSERIGKLRAAAGESQQDLADDLGVKRETVKFWESGERQIKAADIAKLAVHFNVSADYILGLVSVPTCDPELQKVCQYTGLSDKAISSLVDVKKKWPEALEIIDDFLTEYGPPFVLHALRLRDVAMSFNDDFSRIIDPANCKSAKEKYQELQILKGSLQLAAFAFSEMCRDVANSYSVYDYMRDIDEEVFNLFSEAADHGEHQED